MTPLVRHRLLLTSNIPTPYRMAFFDVLAPRLLERGIGFEALFYASTEPGRHWAVDLSSASYPCKILPGIHPRFTGFYPHFNPTIPLELRSRKPTWILIAGAWNTPSSLMASSRRLSGHAYRIFWSESHAQAVLHPDGPIATLRRRVLRGFDGFAVPNELSADYLAGELRGAFPCLRLPNTVDEGFFLAGPSVDRATLRAQFGLPSTDAVFLCVASLHDHKGVLELARATAALPDHERQRVTLVFAGEGPLREALLAVPHAPVRVLGHLEPAKLREWLCAADFFALPSKRDPNPLSVIEAALSALPLLLSARVGNAGDLVPSPTEGWLFPSLEEGTMVNVLLDALSMSEEARKGLGARTRQRAIENFSRAGAADGFIEELCRRFPAPAPSSDARRSRWLQW